MPKTITKKTIKSNGLLCRTHTIDRAHINEDTRSVTLSFSSEAPVERRFGHEILNEVLDHSRESVILDRIRANGPLLNEHDPKQHIGVVESVDIGDDRRGVANVRFSETDEADKIYRQVLEGVKASISVGYRILDGVVEETKKGGLDVFRATKWVVHEISTVSMPADTSVGVGRSESESFEFDIETIKQEARTMPDENTPVAKPEKKVDVAAIETGARDTAIAAERARTSRITKIGDKYNGAELARQFVENGKSVDEFMDALAEQRGDTENVQTPNKPVTQVGLSDNDTQRYSLMRALNASLTGDWKNAGFERECSIEIEDKLGREARGFFVPYEVQSRTMSVGTDTAGGYIVQTDEGGMIDLLRANTVLGAAGATFLPGLVGDVAIPKQTGASTFYWLGEDEDGTDSEPTVGQVLLMPKTCAGAVPMTRKLLKQSSPSVEALVQNDLNRGMALAIDVAGFNGTGVDGQPLGILNTTGISTSTIASAGAPTWIETVEFETDVDTSNALMGNLNWVTTPAVKGSMKTTAKDSGSGLFVADGNTANGYDILTSTQMPTAGILFGDFSSCMIGMWGVMDVMADTATKAASGGLVLRVFQDVDVGVRHIESFCKNA